MKTNCHYHSNVSAELGVLSQPPNGDVPAERPLDDPAFRNDRDPLRTIVWTQHHLEHASQLRLFLPTQFFTCITTIGDILLEARLYESSRALQLPSLLFSLELAARTMIPMEPHREWRTPLCAPWLSYAHLCLALRWHAGTNASIVNDAKARPFVLSRAFVEPHPWEHPLFLD